MMRMQKPIIPIRPGMYMTAALSHGMDEKYCGNWMMFWM